MYPINAQRKLSVIFQHQDENPSAIEIIFEGLVKLNLEPTDEKYDGIIFGAFMAVHDDLIYWADSEDFTINESDNCTWIAAKKAKWRIADEYIGKDEIYISK